MKPVSEFSAKSFGYAWKGLKAVVRTQPNFRFHLCAALVAIFAGWFFHISLTEWCAVLFAIGLVTAAECFNTALEYLVDLVSPQHNELAGKVKDISAAGVLICAVTAAAVGMVIFIPEIKKLF